MSPIARVRMAHVRRSRGIHQVGELPTIRENSWIHATANLTRISYQVIGPLWMIDLIGRQGDRKVMSRLIDTYDQASAIGSV
jgi:hypothetical protein